MLYYSFSLSLSLTHTHTHTHKERWHLYPLPFHNHSPSFPSASPSSDTDWSGLLQKLLIKVRALTTGQLKEGRRSGWVDGCCCATTSETIFSFLFLYSSLNFSPSLRLPHSLWPSSASLHVMEGDEKKSNFHEFDLMDRVVSLICNNRLTPRLKVPPSAPKP